jgi:hypothetical protein
MAPDTANEQQAFTQAAHEGLQRIIQARMALAFLGAGERADHVTAQLHHVTELIGVMCERHALLVHECAVLEDQLDAQNTYMSGGDRGLVVESIGEEYPSSGWGTELGALWVRFRGLVPLLVAMCVLVAVGRGAVGHVQGIVSTSRAASGIGGGGAGAAHVGDTIQTGFVTCTLTSVAVRDVDTPDAQLMSGSESVTVQVKLRNVGNSYISYSRSDFHVRPGIHSTPDSGELTPGDASGVILSSPGDSSSLDTGELAPGDSAEGDLVFEVLHGDHTAELTWQPSPLGDTDEHAWLLGV